MTDNLKPDADMTTRAAPGGLNENTAQAQAGTTAGTAAPAGTTAGATAAPAGTAARTTAVAAPAGATTADQTASQGGRETGLNQDLGPGKVDASAAQPREGFATVQTDQGKLDRAAVRSNAVGGQGVVHEHVAGPEFPPKEPPKRTQA